MYVCRPLIMKYPKEQETNSVAMAGLSTKKGGSRKVAPHVLLLLGRLVAEKEVRRLNSTAIKTFDLQDDHNISMPITIIM